MHDETIAIHGGYTADGTRAVAVPIYQTVAHDFIDAEHAGAVLDLETPGFHYNRINNPTNDVLEQRMAALEGGTAALVLASGMAAVSYSILTVARAGTNFVVAPQLYGATFTYFAHVLPTLGIEARFAVDDRAESIGALIDDNTFAVFCETIGNPGRQRRGPRSGGRRGPPGRCSSDRRQHRGHPADAQADPTRGRRGRALADQVRGRSRHDHRRGDRRRWPVPLGRSRRALPDVQRARTQPSTAWCSPATSPSGRSPCGPAPSSSATPGPRSRPSTPSCCSRGWRRWRSGSTGTRPTPGPSPPIWTPTRGWSG